MESQPCSSTQDQWEICAVICGRKTAMKAAQARRKPSHSKRAHPLSVSGVGRGDQQCTYDCHLPISLKKEDGTRTDGHFDTPTVPKSMLPGLLGRLALKKNRVVIDFQTDKIYLLGPGDYNLIEHLPPGTDVYQGEIAPSGHLMMPCCEYESQRSVGPDNDVSLVTESKDGPPDPISRVTSAYDPRPPAFIRRSMDPPEVALPNSSL